MGSSAGHGQSPAGPAPWTLARALHEARTVIDRARPFLPDLQRVVDQAPTDVEAYAQAYDEWARRPDPTGQTANRCRAFSSRFVRHRVAVQRALAVLDASDMPLPPNDTAQGSRLQRLRQALQAAVDAENAARARLGPRGGQFAAPELEALATLEAARQAGAGLVRPLGRAEVAAWQIDPLPRALAEQLGVARTLAGAVRAGTFVLGVAGLPIAFLRDANDRARMGFAPHWEAGGLGSLPYYLAGAARMDPSPYRSSEVDLARWRQHCREMAAAVPPDGILTMTWLGDSRSWVPQTLHVDYRRDAHGHWHPLPGDFPAGTTVPDINLVIALAHEVPDEMVRGMLTEGSELQDLRVPLEREPAPGEWRVPPHDPATRMDAGSPADASATRGGDRPGAGAEGGGHVPHEDRRDEPSMTPADANATDVHGHAVHIGGKAPAALRDAQEAHRPAHGSWSPGSTLHSRVSSDRDPDQYREYRDSHGRLYAVRDERGVVHTQDPPRTVEVRDDAGHVVYRDRVAGERHIAFDPTRPAADGGHREIAGSAAGAELEHDVLARAHALSEAAHHSPSGAATREELERQHDLLELARQLHEDGGRATQPGLTEDGQVHGHDPGFGLSRLDGTDKPYVGDDHHHVEPAPDDHAVSRPDGPAGDKAAASPATATVPDAAKPRGHDDPDD